MQASKGICPKCGRELPEDTAFCPYDGTPVFVSKTPTAEEIEVGLARQFKIIRRLGAGGMGAVFLAEQLTIGRPVALKVLLRKFLDEPEFHVRFQNEAAATGRIRHPNVVTVYEYGLSDDGAPYIAMEYLEGETLRHLLETRGALSLPEVAEITRQVARGLHAAHKLGIIHRDLKPDNIFVTFDDEAGRLVKVMDFGIAKLREITSRTTSGIVMGTPPYMSFEQASGMRSDQLDARSDIYSLGIVVYEMVTGKVPFHADTPLGYVNKHILEAPPPFREARPDLPIPWSVERVTVKALEKNRDERYATAIQFSGELWDAVMGKHPLPATRFARPRPTVPAGEHLAIKATEGGAAGAALATPPTPPMIEIKAPPRRYPTPDQAPQSPESHPSALPQLPHPQPHSARRTATLLIVVLVLCSAGILIWKNWAFIRPQLHRESATKEPTQRKLPGPPIGMLEIPGGTFVMGRNEGGKPEETPAHSVNVQPFLMDKTLVSNQQYAKFNRAASSPQGPIVNFPVEQGEWPATGVSWHEAEAYCRGQARRLPTEAEWEFAARGWDARLYPWGNQFDPRLSNSLESGLDHPDPVGRRLAAASPFGVLDMSGNVWQWCADDYRPYPGREESFVIPPIAKVIRGGSFKSDQHHVTATTRNFELATERSSRIGFRCAMSR